MTLGPEIEACEGCAPREFMLRPAERDANLEPDCVDCLRRTHASEKARKLAPAPIRWSWERQVMFCSRRIALG